MTTTVTSLHPQFRLTSWSALRPVLPLHPLFLFTSGIVSQLMSSLRLCRPLSSSHMIPAVREVTWARWVSNRFLFPFLCQVFADSLVLGHFPLHVIRLLEKDKDPLYGLNTDVKILAKLLAGRLERLPSVISPDQTGFVKCFLFHYKLFYDVDAIYTYSLYLFLSRLSGFLFCIFWGITALKPYNNVLKCSYCCSCKVSLF